MPFFQAGGGKNSASRVSRSQRDVKNNGWRYVGPAGRGVAGETGGGCRETQVCFCRGKEYAEF